MQADWTIWGGMLGALLLSGAFVAAWLFPGWWRGAERNRGGAQVGAGAQASAARSRGAASVGKPGLTRGLSRLGARRWLPQDGARLWRRGAWWWGGLVLLCLPAALVLAWSRWHPQRLEAFDDVTAPVNAQVSQLLLGEHLVPPAPLPPEVFLAAEIVAEQPFLATADRRCQQMDPAFVQAVLQVFRVMKATHGYDMALLEGWRSPERQALLATRGPAVTRAGPWQSYHQWGLAADCAFLRDGRLVISERDPWARQGYELLGQVAEQFGLTWGGRWQMADLGHIEWRKPGMQAAMRARASAVAAPVPTPTPVPATP